MTQENTYTIQQVANETGLTAYTLRYYEDIGLLGTIHRNKNGHRRYIGADVSRIMFLTRLRKTGMSLDDMKYFIDLYHQGHDTAGQRRELLESHRDVVQAQIKELNEIVEFIDYKIGLYKEEESRQHEVSTTG